MTNAERGDRHHARRAARRACRWRSRSPWRPTGGCRPGRAWPTRSRQVDAATGAAPAYYMINCAHPTHFAHVLARAASALDRRDFAGSAPTPRGAATPSSTRRPTSTTAIRWSSGAQYRELRARHPQLTVLGGCCGTDHRHIERICEACMPDGVSAGQLGDKATFGRRSVRLKSPKRGLLPTAQSRCWSTTAEPPNR